MPVSPSVRKAAIGLFLFLAAPALAVTYKNSDVPYLGPRVVIPVTPERQAIIDATQKEYLREQAVLKLGKLREVPDTHSPVDMPNVPNYDEAASAPYPYTSDVLRLNNGKETKTAAQWWKVRRPQIVEAFDREIFGRAPKVTPKVAWVVTRHQKRKRRRHRRRHPPAGWPGRQFRRSRHQGGYRHGGDLARQREGQGAGDHPVRRGQSAAIPRRAATAAGPRLAGADSGEGLGLCRARSRQRAGRQWRRPTAGIIGLVNKGQPRKMDDWGALRAWAWGASRAVDYLRRRPPVVAANRSASRAIPATARPRSSPWPMIRASPSASSARPGAGGAKLFRHYFGETLENVAAANEFHWMAGNFLKYAADPLSVKDLPVDMDALVALCAPRPLFIGAGARRKATPGSMPAACSWRRRAPIRSIGCWARRDWSTDQYPAHADAAADRRYRLSPA